MEVGENREKALTVEVAPVPENASVVFPGDIGCSVERNVGLRTTLGGGNVEVVPVTRELEQNVVTSGKKGKKGRAAVDLEKGVTDWEKEEEKVCRICHLSSELVGSVGKGLELIMLGCGCKGELGIAHRRCAETWFRVKGNRLCEICGLYAKSIVGEGDDSFMGVGHGSRTRPGPGPGNNTSLDRSGWTSQRFCSFIVSFLVIAFVLQWYFRESFS